MGCAEFAASLSSCSWKYDREFLLTGEKSGKVFLRAEISVRPGRRVAGVLCVVGQVMSNENFNGVLASEMAELNRDQVVTEWVKAQYPDMNEPEWAACCEAQRMFVEAVGRVPVSGVELDGWMNDGSLLEVASTTLAPVEVTGPTDAEVEARKAQEQAELEAKQEQASKGLTNAAKQAGKKLDKAEKAATEANVEAGRLIRAGIREYLLVYPRGKQAAETIVVGQLAQITGASYKVADLVEFAGIADVFGDESLKLALRKFRELAKLVEKAKEGDGWCFLPGIGEGAGKLVKRAVEGEVIPLEQWKADIMTLCQVAEKSRADALRQEAVKLEEEAKAAAGTAAARLKEAEALVNRTAAEFAEKREAMWQERLQKTEDKATEVKANKALATAQRQAGVEPSTVSQQSPSQIRDLSLAWIADVSKTGDKQTRMNLAAKLIGSDIALLRDVMFQCMGKSTVKEQAEVASDCLDTPEAMNEFVSHVETELHASIVAGIQINPELRKAVVKRFGKTGKVAIPVAEEMVA